MTISQQIPVATLGVPRFGRRRELKFALESYWSGKSSAADLLTTAKALRAASWEEQHDRGVSKIPSNDFSLYDHVLDTAAMVGAVPSRYGWNSGEVPLDIYFAMARGNQGQTEDCRHAGHQQAAHRSDVTAMEMTKWFDTNYHYIVPELNDDQTFALSSTKPVDYFIEAKALGVHTRPVILRPITFLKLAKSPAEGFDPIALLPRLLPVYEQLLQRLKLSGADWVQIDEPALVLDLNPNERAAFEFAYGQLSKAAPELKIMLATYFGPLGDNLETAVSLPLAGLHIDLVRAPEQLETVGRLAPKDLVLSLGLIDGRNVWRANLPAILDRIKPIVAGWPLDRVEIAPSCSMLHVPIDLRMETELDADIRSWLAFAAQKTDELVLLARALSQGRDAVAGALKASAEAAATRVTSTKIHDPLVEGRIASIDDSMKRRESAFAERSRVQAGTLGLPPFPTTTIGSFPQTPQVRRARAAHAKGQLSYVDYETFLKKEIEAAIRWQDYLDWAVECFRIASTGVKDATQIHTHMCYSEFNEIIDAIAEMDADVISIETSRSKMELLDAFTSSKYPNEIGPGVYDIHSPRVPAVGEISDLVMLARERLSDAQLWVNPDCGLKTRKWEEVRPALMNMVAAARALREKV
ncbi:5-methyltetrahydropteroyltriglutamate--homocysteine S-methyltransferase [Mesorhizobium sp. M0622]|uniref:5-methyltetrahydropteroyltriglutamate-- homocysteine S-methyltransferase n=1 Tax=Mesorhizobium sp. M0622 TaxID=2956975 RepID=UPI003334C6CC